MRLATSLNLHSFTTTSETLNTQASYSDNDLLQGLIEGFFDGILILTEQGECIQANNLARQICLQLTPTKSQLNSVPKEIWDVCQALIESRVFFPTGSMIIESEIASNQATTLRIRVRWFKLNAFPHPCLLVILEDRCQSRKKLALAEVDRYGLTPREAEVWLRRRANYTYKEIATDLYISINTVKKHMKNIQAKRETVLDLERCR
jgi:DNA-binding CsgD family transcriptional regulator